ncbi:unnamed protein product [marine sediment metagenome]|uniref:Uncharacterized protein n=1 Tax=marine sediment metagenome TaxID=412755 RepID=X1TFZ8_9ZZZZ
MAELAGKHGSVTLANAQLSVKNWSMSLVGDALETTNFDNSTGGRSYIPGLKGWSGSFECNYSTGNTALPGSSGTIICKTSTGITGVFKGGIIITGMDVTTPIDGIVTQSYTFQGTGAVGLTS